MRRTNDTTTQGAIATTYLFVPANRPQRLSKACAAGADAVIIDLEDAVDPADKALARDALHSWLTTRAPATDTDPELWVRMNAVGTPWFEHDLSLLKRHTSALTGIMLPKTEAGRDIDALQALGLPVIALVESARGLLGLADICAHPGVQRLAFGSADLARDLGCEDAWDTLLPHRAQLVLHAAAAGLPPPIDGVSFALDEPDRVTADARQALRLGMGAKLCIHPTQLAACRRGFAPTEAQQHWAQQVLAAAAAGQGAQRLAGQMIDRPVIERARLIMSRVSASPAV